MAVLVVVVVVVVVVVMPIRGPSWSSSPASTCPAGGKSALRRMAWVPMARRSAEATRKTYPICGAGSEDGAGDMTCIVLDGSG